MEEGLAVSSGSEPCALAAAASARATFGASMPGGRPGVAWQRPEELPGVEILAVDQRAGRWRLYHDGYSICTPLRLTRTLEWRGGGAATRQGSDELVMVEPGQVQAVSSAALASFRLASIPAQVLERAAAELGRRLNPRARVAVLGGPGARAFQRLHQALEGGAGTLERETHFTACLGVLLEQWDGRISAAHGAEHAGIARARDHLEAHLTDSVTLETLAGVASMSRFHLLRAFARRFGAPPHAFQLARRISRARELLRSGVRASEAAVQLGFADQSHLSRHFRAAMGVTPTAYAAAVRGK